MANWVADQVGSHGISRLKQTSLVGSILIISEPQSQPTRKAVECNRFRCGKLKTTSLIPALSATCQHDINYMYPIVLAASFSESPRKNTSEVPLEVNIKEWGAGEVYGNPAGSRGLRKKEGKYKGTRHVFCNGPGVRRPFSLQPHNNRDLEAGR